MISKTLGTSSRKFARLRERHPHIGLFAQALYPLIVASSDDFGRLQGDAFTIKHSVWSTAPDDETKFEDALMALVSEQLIERYDVGGETFLQVVDFDRHQAGLHKRTESCFPPPGGAMAQAEESVLDASERAIEERFAAGFLDGSIRISDWSVARVERQVRRENSYLDLVITSNDGRIAVVELKRQRVTQSAVDQVLSYTRFYPGSVPIVIGHGIAASSLDPKGCIICTYGDDLCVRTVYKSTTPGLVNLTVETVEITSLLREQNRTEEKGTEQKAPAALKPRPQKYGRVTLHRWQLDELIDILGPNGVGFELDAWVMSLSQKADEQGLALARDEVWTWVQSELKAECQRRGIKTASSAKAPQLSKRTNQILAAVQAIQERGE